MSSSYQTVDSSSLVATAGAEPQWYAVHTRPRHEKKVVSELGRGGIVTFLPLSKQIRRWSDRRKRVEFPLFPCYVFVQIAATPETRVSVLRPYGVLGFVGPQHGTPIPASQIEAIRTLVLNDVAITAAAYLRVGQRVRIRGGVLDGVEGILATAGERRLVVSIETIQRSISVSLEGYEVEPV